MNCIIFDNGSSLSKVGFAGDSSPRAIFPTITCREKFGKVLGNDVYVAEQAIYRHGRHSNEVDVLLLETPLNTNYAREMTTQIMFETCSVMGLGLANQCVMSLLASGRTSGIVLDSGDGTTDIVPIYEGCAIPNGSFKLELAGKDLTDTLKGILMEGIYDPSTINEMELIREMKEKFCYVARNFNEELKNPELSQYELPDGNVITLGSERFRTTEILFQPHLIGKEFGGIHELIVSSIRKCDIDIRKELYSKIVLAGSTTLIRGTAERLSHELEILSATMKNCVIALPERNLLPYIGGDIFASMSTFSNSCIRQEEYNEYGPNVVRRKYWSESPTHQTLRWSEAE